MTPLLSVENLKVEFNIRKQVIHAVNGISYHVYPGETLGIVGESGSGKSVSQLSYLKLLPHKQSKITSGKAIFKNEHDLLKLSQKEIQPIRGNRIAMIFQDPMTSLNPYLRIGYQITEPLRVHFRVSKKEAYLESCRALEKVGISDPTRICRSFPHELSGGMRQRVMIAMALTTKPDLLIADEPTTALDVTIQAQIIHLLKEIKKETNMSIIFISHDLGVIANIADRVAVMYAGKIMECAETEELFLNRQNPYTHELILSNPRIDCENYTAKALKGSPPRLFEVPKGCSFFDRCDYRLEKCREKIPPYLEVRPNHSSLCHLPGLPV